MALTPGTRLGPHEITAQIGEGGMGEVYRARDTKLDRDVAIKVLPDIVAQDAERLARFDREAKTLAALNHPGIAAIYGLEESDGIKALVMELVEGPTLADRIALGPIPVDEALPIAKQIAEALEAAHEQGIIHRDLKPANIKVRPDGTVKVLDFGLAKAMEPAGVASGSTSVSMSPTITTPAMTQMGMILGTAAYMSPEQAKGRVADKRSDVWAFGAVLYEMLTGRRAFQGEDVSETLADVMRVEPSWEYLPPGLSPSLVTYLKRCLRKNPKERIRDIGDVHLALEGAFETPAGAPDVVVAPRLQLWQRPGPAAGAAVLLVALAAIVAWSVRPAPEPGAVNRFAYDIPEDQNLRRTGRPVLALAPDGRSFVYNTDNGLYLRTMGDLAARLIAGTEEDLSNPFFSPDGQWVGYYAFGPDQLKRIAVSGGAPVVMASDIENPSGVTWAADGSVLFGQPDGIQRVAATGGTSELVIAAAPGEQVFGPQLLPDGDSVLFSVTTTDSWDDADIVVQSLSTGDRTVLLQGGSDAHYVPTGHLVYALGGDLLGMAFDVDRLAVTGGAVPLAQGLRRTTYTGTANYGVSDDGTLVYLTGSAAVAGQGLSWVGPNNQEEPLGTPRRGYVSVSLSPDGQRAALEIEEDGESNIWVTELARGTLFPITTEEGFDGYPLWAPDGRRVVFTTVRDGRVELRSKAADGTGEASTLVAFDETVDQVRAASWSPDGSTLAIGVDYADSVSDVGLVSVAGGADWRPLIQTEASEGKPEVSPDGRWIAYQSNESGPVQVYVQRFPGLGDRRQVSVGTDSHHSPTWSPDGALLFLRGGPPDAVLRATVGEDAAGAPVVGPAAIVLDYRRYWSRFGAYRTYDIAPDGRILVVTAADASDTSVGGVRPPVVVVQHWTEELKRLVPTN